MKPPSIGTKNESSLHRSLKIQYSGEGGETETSVGSYVCDGCTSEGDLIEVQTTSFGSVKRKILALCKDHRLILIHPIIIRKYIDLYDAKGNLQHRRKSPKKGSTWDLFDALLYAPELALEKNLCIELPHVDVVESRINDGSGSRRRKGVRIKDRALESYHHTIRLAALKDYQQFMPFTLKEEFTVSSFAERAQIPRHMAQKAVYTLNKMGLLKMKGKQGRAMVYGRVSRPKTL